MVRPKGFIRLIGAEYDLMVQAGTNVLVKFYLSSVVIMMILLISLFAIHYAVDLLFHIEVVEIILSAFFSTLFVFIYIFLLNTFTKKESSTTNKYLKLSNFIRIGFVVFMAFMISKPIEIYLFNEVLEQEVLDYKQQVLSEHQKKLDAIFSGDLKRLFNKATYYQEISTSGNPLQPELDAVSGKIKEINKKKQRIMDVAREKVENSSFFIFRIKQLSKKHPLSFLVCLLVIGLFILPGYIIYSISTDDTYYKLKTEYEEGLIRNTYSAFLVQYRKLSLQHFATETDYYTVFEDAPFNIKRKPDNNYQPETEFFKKYR